jgi:DNA-directed RNA polymerase subunit K/omega
MPDSVPPPEPDTATPAELAPVIESRFLFVDVAAQRANQLRRGARLRLAAERPQSNKLERAAMEEVKQQLVSYTVPELPSSR